MLTRKICKTYHGKEVQWKIPKLSRRYSAVILATMKNGVSIKPYWDDEEKEIFIKEWMELTKRNRAETEKMLASPTFCFAEFTKQSLAKTIRTCLAAEEYLAPIQSHGNPICHHI